MNKEYFVSNRNVLRLLLAGIFLMLVSCNPDKCCTPPNDKTAPVITLLGESPTILIEGTSYKEAGATAMDNIDGQVTVVIHGKVDVNKVGNYSIVYTSTDKAGNKASLTRRVIVKTKNKVDIKAPTITLLGQNPTILIEGTSYKEAGATAMDNIDGQVTVVIHGKVDVNKVGAYSIVYTSTDKAGNQASLTRKVIVKTNVIIDSDKDGLSDKIEKKLGTNINYYDTDCDGIRDDIEVGLSSESPLDSDDDGIIDALESMLADNNKNGIVDSLDPEIADIQIACPRFTPFAVKDNGSETTTFEILISGRDINQIRINVSGKVYRLFDDGSHGDKVAFDNIYSNNSISNSANMGYLTVSSLEEVEVITSNSTNIINFNNRKIFTPILRAVPASQQSTPMLKIKQNVFIASNFINIIDSDLSLEIRKNDFNSEVIKMFYSFFIDDFDFINIKRDFKISEQNIAGSANLVQNNVKGIGMSVFNDSSMYGSDGKLKSIIVDGAFLHEIAHTWGINLDKSLGFGQGYLGENINYGHTGVIGTGKGFLGGYNADSLIDNGNGTYSVDSFYPDANARTILNNSSIPIDYSMLELYLMGLADFSEIPDFSVPENPSNPIYNMGTVTFSADRIQFKSITDVINIEGQRIPNIVNSQKDFTFASVIFSDVPLTETEMASFNIQAKSLGAITGDRSFQERTKNRATLRTLINSSMLRND